MDSAFGVEHVSKGAGTVAGLTGAGLVAGGLTGGTAGYIGGRSGRSSKQESRKLGGVGGGAVGGVAGLTTAGLLGAAGGATGGYFAGKAAAGKGAERRINRKIRKNLGESMYSAFGVDHGDNVSKGLPSALRRGGKAQSALSGFLTDANKDGKKAAKAISQGKGQTKHLIHGQMGKDAFKTSMEGHNRPVRWK